MSQLIHLDRNEYYCSHHPDVIRALSNPIHADLISHYAKHSRLFELRKILAESIQAPEKQIVLGHGAEDISIKILSWFKAQYDTLVLEDFSWTNYVSIGEGFGYKITKIKTIDLRDRFTMDYQDFEIKLEQEKKSIFLITSPNNPTVHDIDLDFLFPLVDKYKNHLFL